jgi:formylmethanofuran dehydrogenase subunit E
MSQEFVDEQVYEISFPEVEVDGGGLITASIVCKQCGALIPINKKAKKKRIRSAKGI